MCDQLSDHQTTNQKRNQLISYDFISCKFRDFKISIFVLNPEFQYFNFILFLSLLLQTYPEQNLYLRSDVSGPLELNSLDQQQNQNFYYAAAAAAAAEQTKLGHMLMNNYSQMQPPPYPISYNPAVMGEEGNKVSV
jgi:hypothetical protein